jgi:membrane-bound hydrogenase subunit beta
MTEHLSAPAVLERFTGKFGAGVTNARVQERREGIKKNPNYNLWMDLDRPLLKDAIRELQSLGPVHLSVVSGTDLGETVRLIYTFCLYYGIRHGEYTVNFGVSLPKDDLTIPTISDLVPGAVFTEREKQEMLGVTVVGIPDNRGLFLPEDFPKGVYPWRKDATGIPDSMVKNLWEVRRPKGRPAPAVTIAEGKGECAISEKEITEPEAKPKKPAKKPAGEKKESEQPAAPAEKKETAPVPAEPARLPAKKEEPALPAKAEPPSPPAPAKKEEVKKE